MIKGLRTIIFPVKEISEAKIWYSNVLGVEPYFDMPFYVGFNLGGYELGLLPDGTPSVDGCRSYWGVENIESSVENFINHGAIVIEPITDVGEGIKVSSIADPFGNRFGLIFNPNFKLP